MNEHVQAILSAAGPILLSLASAVIFVAARWVTRALQDNQKAHEELAEKIYRADLRLAQTELRLDDNAMEHKVMNDRQLIVDQAIVNHGERLTRVETRFDMNSFHQKHGE